MGLPAHPSDRIAHPRADHVVLVLMQVRAAVSDAGALRERVDVLCGEPFGEVAGWRASSPIPGSLRSPVNGHH